MSTDPRWHAIWASLKNERQEKDRLALELARYFYDFGCHDVCVSVPDFPYKTDSRCCADVSGHYYGNTWFGIVSTSESIASGGVTERVRSLSSHGMVVMAVPAGCCNDAWDSVKSQNLDVVEIREY